MEGETVANYVLRNIQMDPLLALEAMSHFLKASSATPREAKSWTYDPFGSSWNTYILDEFKSRCADKKRRNALEDAWQSYKAELPIARGYGLRPGHDSQYLRWNAVPVSQLCDQVSEAVEDLRREDQERYSGMYHQKQEQQSQEEDDEEWDEQEEERVGAKNKRSHTYILGLLERVSVQCAGQRRNLSHTLRERAAVVDSRRYAKPVSHTRLADRRRTETAAEPNGESLVLLNLLRPKKPKLQSRSHCCRVLETDETLRNRTCETQHPLVGF